MMGNGCRGRPMHMKGRVMMRLKRGIVLLMILAFAVGTMSGCGKTADSDGYAATLYSEEYIKEMDYHDGFTILQMTDLHWSGATQIGNDEFGAIEYVKKVVREAEQHAGKIDLIEVTGDTFMLANKRAVRKFIDMMTDIGIPYAMTWGNHDRESHYNPNWLSRQFMEAPFSLYTEVDNDELHDRSNYVINLMDGADVAWQIFMLDSGASYREGAADLKMTYDYMRQEQVDWVSVMHKHAGVDVPALAYYHIPPAEVKAALNAYRDGSATFESKFFMYEGVGSSQLAPDTTRLCKDNNIRGVFLGHDHANDWTYTSADGVVYGFGVKTGPELYIAQVTTDYEGSGVDFDEDFDLIGASLVTLTDRSGEFTLEHLYLNERDEGDFVMWVTY